MTTWKDIACERLVIPRHAKDSHVLDELIRYEIEGGNRLLQIRDQLAKLLHFLCREEVITSVDSANGMIGVIDTIQILRTKVANHYRAEAEGLIDVVREDFQPPANYTDSPTQGTLAERYREEAEAAIPIPKHKGRNHERRARSGN